jgi:hypothetical protein
MARVELYLKEDIMNTTSISYQWPCPPATGKIYQLDEALRTPPDLSRLTTSIGISSPTTEAWEELGSVFQYERKPHELTLYRPSHALRYANVDLWQVDDRISELKISDDEAFAAAHKVTDQLALFGDDVFMPTKVSRLNVRLANKGQAISHHRIIDVGVVFTRVLDGLPVEGPGGKIVIYLGSELQLTGLEKVARPIVRVDKEVEGWREADEVLDEIQQYWKKPLGTELVVEQVRLGYLELGRLQPQNIMQPVYLLVLRFGKGENGATHRIEHFVHAAQNGSGDIMPTRCPEPQSFGRTYEAAGKQS